MSSSFRRVMGSSDKAWIHLSCLFFETVTLANDMNLVLGEGRACCWSDAVLEYGGRW